jgi:tetratricopeptide (TPR) repeat protein
VRFTLAQALQKAGKVDEAIEQLRLLATDGPYRTASANDLAYLLAEHHPEKLDEAYALASEASKQRPEFAPLQDTLGWIEHQRKNDVAAVKLLSEAVTRLRDVPEVHLHLGVVYKALGQEAWAGYHLDKAAESETTKEAASRARQALGK